MGEIIWLGRYPVKSLRGESLADLLLDEAGVVGDRQHALIDTATGLIASAKNPRRWRALLSITAVHRPGLFLRFSDGTEIGADDPTVHSALSEALGRDVRLISTRPDGASLERLTPEVEAGAGTMTRNVLPPGARFVDFGAVHLVTTATLDALGGADRRRFRPNLVLRMADAEPFAENGWVGRRLRADTGAVLSVLVPTPRCPVPTLAQGDELPEDPGVLRAAARLNRVQVFDLGRLTCVGVYASVTAPGALRVGDTIRVL